MIRKRSCVVRRGAVGKVPVTGQLAGVLPYTFPSKEEQKIEGPYRIELRCYGSPDDLGLGRYRSHILEGVYETQELAEEEISIQEPLLQAAEAIAAMVPVPAVATVS